MIEERFWRWSPGRQGTGYEKKLLMRNRLLLPFDVYLLRYRVGARVPSHIDPVEGKRHFRLNWEVWRASEGGGFRCERTICSFWRWRLFRPDVAPHEVTEVTRGVRYVLSLGWVRAW